MRTVFYTTMPGPPVHDARGNRTWKPLPETDRYWAVGCSPNARYAHRIIGEMPGHGCMQTVCKHSIWLHGETNPEGWPNGGVSYNCVDEIPDEFTICLKCVSLDETVA